MRMTPRIGLLGQNPSTTAVENFWSEVIAAGTPLVQPVNNDMSLVTFVWRGDAQSMVVEWGVHATMERLSGTNLWHATVTLPSRLRTVYYFAQDGADGVPRSTGPGPTRIDPWNRRPFCFPGDPDDPTDDDSWVSLLELPLAPPEPWRTRPAGVRAGTTVAAVLDSAALGGPRRVEVHLPAETETDGLPVLVVFDGYLSRTVLAIPATVDSLVAAGRIPPVVCLFVNSPNDVRNDELNPYQPIVGFVADELLPWARRTWGVTADPGRSVIAGVSRGGLAAAWVALCRPDAVGAVIAQSGSFWWPSASERPDGDDQAGPEWLTRRYAARPRLPLRFYLEVGDRETGPGPDGAPSQVTVNRRFRDTLRERGYPVVYSEYLGAHDYVNWRRTFADGLIAMLAG